jgi:hypothetical protein
MFEIFNPEIVARCPYCGTKIRGTLDNIDSGLRKHIEYCDKAPDDE